MNGALAQTIGFLAFAFLIIISGISMIAARRVIHSAIFLLVAMLSVAGIYTLLGAQFLAAMQVMVYAGAVMVLVLFTVMLTLSAEPAPARRRELSRSALAIAAAFGFLVYSVLAGRPVAMGQAVAPETSVAALGTVLFKDWVLPFELASVVLLIALVAAVHIALEGER